MRFALKKAKVRKTVDGEKDKDNEDQEGKDKQPEDLRRSQRITDKDPIIPVLKKRTASEANLIDKQKRQK